MVETKQIILIPSQPPQFLGNWTLGEVRQMAQGLLMWLDSLTVHKDEPKDADK